MLGCTELYWTVLGYNGLCLAVLGCAGLYWAVLALLCCAELYWAVLGQTFFGAFFKFLGILIIFGAEILIGTFY